VANKRLYFVTKVSDHGSVQSVHEADDLHHLVVIILGALVGPQGNEYTDAQVIERLTNAELWDSHTFYLISVYNPGTNTLHPLVKDPYIT
jgi:hypothetical protein